LRAAVSCLAVSRRRWSLRAYLVALTLVASVPLLVFATVLVVRAWHGERAALERGVLDTARALSLAVDRELDGSITSLQVLATSPHLTTATLDSFYAECAELLKLYPAWNNVLLFDPSGTQIFNLLQPLGTPLPDAVDRPHFHDVVRSRRPGVSNLIEGLVLRRQLISVRFPVVRDNRVKYVLTAGVDPQAFERLLGEQKLAPGWVASILDRRNVYIASTRGPGLAGAEAPAAIARRVAEAREQTFRALIEGIDMTTALSTSAQAGWTVAIAVPSAEIDAGLRRSLVTVAGAGLFALALAGGIATLLGQRLTAIFRAVAAAAAAIGRGRPLGTVEHFPVTEAQAARDAIVQAAGLLEERAMARERLAAIVASSDDAIMGKTLNGILTEWNKGAERLLGYGADEVLGRPMTTIVPPEKLAEENDVLARLRRGEKIDHFDTQRMRKDGSRVDVSLTVSPIKNPGGHIVGASTIARDVTDRKRTEERQTDLLRRERAVRLDAESAARRARFLSEASSVLASSLEYTTTLATVVRLAVPAIADVCAIDVRGTDGTIERLATGHADPIQERRIQENRRRHGSHAAGPIATVLRTGQAELMPEVGDEHLARISANPEQLTFFRAMGITSGIFAPLVAQGDVLGVLTLLMTDSGRRYGDDDLVNAQDLAHRAAIAIQNARLFGEAEGARRQAEAANRLKDEFLATLSHELRTPMNAVLGWAELLAAGGLDEDRTVHAVRVIKRNAVAQAQMIEDLLDVSRITTGKLRLDVRAVTLAAVIEAVLDALKPAADAKDIRVQSVLDPQAGPVSGDPQRLQQVVWNILSNAIKFTPRNGRVQVQLLRASSHVEIVVSDTGPGIDPEVLPYIFDRFRQGDSSSTRTHGGLGIGLALVKHLVELHGGTVEATSSSPDQGATFIVKLPTAMYGAARQATQVHPTQRGDIPEPVVSLVGVRALVVEDDADGSHLLREMLAARGAEVRTAPSVAEAFEILKSWRPTVLLSDIEMPGEDGYVLMKRLRSLPPDQGGTIPAIAVTAYGRMEDRIRIISAGYQMHVVKPLQAVEVIAMVAKLSGTRG
jgi:PAS domain S-box-containing protein